MGNNGLYNACVHCTFLKKNTGKILVDEVDILTVQTKKSNINNKLNPMELQMIDPFEISSELIVPKSINDFKILKMLGKGAFGKVLLAEKIDDSI